ncbi:MAG: deoxynucleoside kinase [Anaerolineales bacterium]
MYIAIEGVIGVGKTTLVRLLQTAFQAEILLEEFEENPFLSKFYEDRARYAFQTQTFFLLSRYHQQRRIHADARSLIADYTFDKDALFAGINLRGDELEIYNRLHDALAEKIRPPDLVVYLRANVNTLMQRIALRDRAYERNMQRTYIEELHLAYEDFYRAARWRSLVLVINASEMDFVQNTADLQNIETRIRQALNLPPFQAVLPL